VEAAQRETLRNVYVFGSRVHQCHQPDADYDLIAIVEGPYFEGAPPYLLFFASPYIDNLYILIFILYWHSRVVAWLMAKRHTRAEVDRGGRSQREPVP
jgi:predicted nucleotidyltransferase